MLPENTNALMAEAQKLTAEIIAESDICRRLTSFVEEKVEAMKRKKVRIEEILKQLEQVK